MKMQEAVEEPWRAFVVVISGPSGAGKSTLVERVARALGEAIALYYDAYAGVARWHPSCREWVEQGCDPNAWVTIPRLAEDLRALRAGRAIALPGSGRVIDPAPYIVLEEPWGRDRDELRPWIDFVAHVSIPLDISLCRKLLREYGEGSPRRDPLPFLAEYLSSRLGELYRRQQQVGERADLVVDGLQPPDELAAEIAAKVRLSCAARM
jgi:uridine kinase